MDKDCKCNPCKNCGCPEPVFSVEAMPDDPTVLRFNVNGKSVWYDFSPVVKTGETATTLAVNTTGRTLDYHGEKDENTIAARELGSILHLADLSDVDADSVTDYGILNYRRDSECPEGCEGVSDGWRADNPIDVSEDALSYVLGSDADGRLASLRTPASANKFSYLAWKAQDKAQWSTPSIVTTPPTDGTYKYPLYLDPSTGEIVAVREAIQ